MKRISIAGAHTLDQYFCVHAVELGGVEMQRGRDQKSLCQHSLQLELLAALQPISDGLEGSLRSFRVHVGAVERKNLSCLTNLNIGHNRQLILLVQNCRGKSVWMLLNGEKMSGPTVTLKSLFPFPWWWKRYFLNHHHHHLTNVTSSCVKHMYRLLCPPTS